MVQMTSANFLNCVNMVGKYKDQQTVSARFEGCTLFNREPKFTATASLNYMFQGCANLKQTLARIKVNNTTNMFAMCRDLDINEPGTTANYDNTLIAWAGRFNENNLKYNVTADFGYTMFSVNAQEAKDFLVGTMNWNIRDGGRIDGIEESFDFTIDTRLSGSTSSNSFKIPFTGSGYNIKIFWGDGLSEIYVGTLGDISHTYSTSGIYKIRIEGTLPRIYFNNTGDCKKVIALDK